MFAIPPVAVGFPTGLITGLGRGVLTMWEDVELKTIVKFDADEEEWWGGD